MRPRRPDPEPPSQAEDVDDSLERALAQNDEIAAATWDFAWINKPITLWLLSTIAVGVISFLISNYNSCQVEMAKDNDRVAHLIAELIGRADRLAVGGDNRISSQAGKDDNGIPQRLQAVVQLIDPDVTFQYADLKGRWSDEVAYEARKLLRKWNRSELPLEPLVRGNTDPASKNARWDSFSDVTGPFFESIAASRSVRDFASDTLARPDAIQGRALTNFDGWRANLARLDIRKALAMTEVPTGHLVCIRRTMWPR